MAELISPEQKQFVIDTIRAVFPDVEILAFGSRIMGGAKQYSDLDIALHAKADLPLAKLGDIKERFSESDLPFKVDLSDFALLTQEFQQIVRRTAVVWK